MITNDEEMESCDTLYELQSNRRGSAVAVRHTTAAPELFLGRSIEVQCRTPAVSVQERINGDQQSRQHAHIPNAHMLWRP